MASQVNGGHRAVGKTTDSSQLARNSPRLLVIGAGSRGRAYAEAVTSSTSASIVSVAEPIEGKRQRFGRKYIWSSGVRQDDQEFDSWEDFLKYETRRRKRLRAGESDGILPGIDGVFVCTLDETHVEIITALAPLGLHIMSEKPLATTLSDCLSIYRSLNPPGQEKPASVFSIGHVLRYSPHNILLRKLLVEDALIGDIVSIEHTEPVGWWHFAHSYVRGNWRKESRTAPSLLTKSCHDIDLVLWLLCTPSASQSHQLHLPRRVSSVGSLSYFKKSRKPIAAGKATNCLSCPAELDCMYSAKKIYVEQQLSKGNAGWPVSIIVPEIEDCIATEGRSSAEKLLISRLEEDYGTLEPDGLSTEDDFIEDVVDSDFIEYVVDSRPWFGRCVYESRNDVCDDQVVTISWDEEPPQDSLNTASASTLRGPKTAIIHMTAFTEKQCERRGRIYGTKGEIEYDSRTIRVYDFATQEAKQFYPTQAGGGHGGGDAGLANSYVNAIVSVNNGEMSLEEAQRFHIGCTLEDAIRSHAMVFAAEEARRDEKVVDWKAWWALNVEAEMRRR